MDNQLRKPVFLFLIFGTLGIFDAGYLTYLHYTATSPFCSIFNHCDVVLTSPYAILFGVPVALIGLVYYLAVSGLSALALFKRNLIFLKGAGVLVTLGFLISLYFLSIQIFVLHSFCLYCLFSAIISAILFVLFYLPILPKLISLPPSSSQTSLTSSSSSTNSTSSAPPRP
jgi:uncharacterized membrane protein